MEIDAQLKKLIEENALAFATVDESGKPHCIAIGFAKVVSPNQILITDNFMGETRINLKTKPQVSLCVWSRDWEENCVGFELKGNAEVFTEGQWHDQVKKMPKNEGCPCKAAILVTVEKIKKLS